MLPVFRGAAPDGKKKSSLCRAMRQAVRTQYSHCDTRLLDLPRPWMRNPYSERIFVEDGYLGVKSPGKNGRGRRLFGKAQGRANLAVEAVEILEALQLARLVDREGEVGQVHGQGAAQIDIALALADEAA